MAFAGIGCLLIGGCASYGAVGRSTEIRGADSTAPTYTVKPHDTLYGIAWRHDLDYRDLARWNNLGPEYKLTVGEVLVLRPPAQSAPAAPAPTPAPRQAAAPSPDPASAPEPAFGSTPIASASDPHGPVAAVDGLHWVWPTDRVSAPRPVPGGGILLFGRLGQDVRAAGAGRVVYTGSGIRGLGNLVIIKHGDTLLSSYAHNSELLVHEGQDVSMGQLIARMGNGPHRVCALYFEIRRNGRPTDPLRYLAPGAAK